MIISIFGFTGSGKTTIAEIIAEKLGYKHISPTFKDIAKRKGMSVIEFQELAEKNENIDREFDEALKEMAQGNCVVSTWLAPWLLKCDIRIKLKASLEERAKRIEKRERISHEKALEYIKQKDRQNIERYKKIYGINIEDESIFDAIIDTEGKSKEEVAEEVLKIIERWKHGRS